MRDHVKSRDEDAASKWFIFSIRCETTNHIIIRYNTYRYLPCSPFFIVTISTKYSFESAYDSSLTEYKAFQFHLYMIVE